LPWVTKAAANVDAQNMLQTGWPQQNRPACTWQLRRSPNAFNHYGQMVELFAENGIVGRQPKPGKVRLMPNWAITVAMRSTTFGW